MSLKSKIIFLVCFLGLGITLNFFLNSYIQALAISFLINSMMAMSLNFITGVANQFSLGSAGFVAVGAYTSAVLTKEVFNDQWYFIPLTAAIGAIVAAFAGYLVSLPSFKLKGDYLAIVTLGFAEIVRVIFLNWNHVGGPRGYNAIVKWPNFTTAYLFTGTAVLITLYVLYSLKISWFGRNLWALNEDEIAAEVMGTPIAKNKRTAFMVSSFFGGLAGGFYAHNMGYISPGSFGFLLSVQILIITVLGGLGSISGSIIASIILTVLPELLRSLPTGGVDIRMIVFPILLILMMIVRPEGLFGKKEIWTFFKKEGGS
ncbi:MAG: branched-chain amino acid ABC transporter permease [Bdellovibrionaceae bacterium]|nr:branched-chain amino acid ABC transporter permease [Pseudobdellovibrionaceae bacterium]